MSIDVVENRVYERANDTQDSQDKGCKRDAIAFFYSRHDGLLTTPYQISGSANMTKGVDWFYPMYDNRQNSRVNVPSRWLGPPTGKLAGWRTVFSLPLWLVVGVGETRVSEKRKRAKSSTGVFWANQSRQRKQTDLSCSFTGANTRAPSPPHLAWITNPNQPLSSFLFTSGKESKYTTPLTKAQLLLLSVRTHQSVWFWSARSNSQQASQEPLHEATRSQWRSRINPRTPFTLMQLAKRPVTARYTTLISSHSQRLMAVESRTTPIPP